MNEMMIFKITMQVDKRGRIFLPSKESGVEPGENVYLFYSEGNDSIIIKSEKKVYELSRKYVDADPKEREEKLAEINEFISSCVGAVKVDSQKRIVLGQKVCSDLHLGDSVFLVGCFDEIRLYPSEEVYEQIVSTKIKTKSIK